MKRKLSNDQKSEICEQYKTGLYTHKQLAQKYSVAECTISSTINRVPFTCSKCEVVSWLAPDAHKRKSTTFCKKCCNKETQGGVNRPLLRGSNHGKWKGGRYIGSDGYINVAVGRNENGKQVYKKEHIVVYEQFLGRQLKSNFGEQSEQIHHIDGDKTNNELSNLSLCKSSKDHRTIHAQLQQIAYALVKSGIIKFDKETNQYYLEDE